MQVERSASVSSRKLLAVIAGEAQFSSLNSHERTLAHATIDARMAERSRLDLIAGPNGAGKTTFFEQIIAPDRPGLPFVNTDRIARDRFPGDETNQSYKAAKIARRARRLSGGRRRESRASIRAVRATKARLTSLAARRMSA